MLSARESAGDMFSSTICDVTCRGTEQSVESADVSEAPHSHYRATGPQCVRSNWPIGYSVRIALLASSSVRPVG
jgi:hypothetical protein